MTTAQATARPYLIDRSTDADRVIEYLLEGRRRLAVLYGQRGSRRRELIRDWIIPRLERTGHESAPPNGEEPAASLGGAVDPVTVVRVPQNRRDVFYGDCDPELPHTVNGALQELPLEDALRRGAMVFLGRMERC